MNGGAAESSIGAAIRARARRAPVLGAALLAACLLLLGGCGTLVDLSQPAHARGRRVFGGVRRDVAALIALLSDGIPALVYVADHPYLLLLAPLDLPLSLAADLVLLPVTALHALVHAEEPAPTGR